MPLYKNREEMLKLENLGMENGKLQSFAFPGGYPLFYLAKDNGVLCPDCANGDNGSECCNPDCQDDPQWWLIGCDINYENDSLYCDHCGKLIESAYGDDDNKPDCEDE